MSQPKVILRVVDGRVVVEPGGYLGQSFDTYRRACAGARYDGESQTWSAEPEIAMRIASRLADAGFLLIYTKEALALVQGEAMGARDSVADARKRLEHLERKLKSRGRRLFPFQKKGVIWAASRRRVVNCDDMGLGKTIQALCSLPDDAGVLVICPAIAKGVWRRETKVWREEYGVTVLSGMGSFRWPHRGEVVVINYDLLPDADKLPSPPRDFDLVLIVDEAHYLKNWKSLRTKRATAISEKVSRALFLTGTPLPNRPDELWSVLSVAGVAREAFGTWKEYVRCFSGRKNPHGGVVWGKPLPEVGERLKQVLIRRLKKDVLIELPPKMYRVVEVDMNLDAESRKKLEKEIAELGPEVWNATELSEIPFEKMSRTRALLARAKESAVNEIVEKFEEAEEPLIVFSHHTHLIEQFIGRKGWGVITGSEAKGEDRDKIAQAFQAGKLIGIAATIGSSSTALTLTRAKNAVFIDLSWVPADNQQSEDRIYRIGQDFGVMITHLVSAHPLDQHVRNLIAKKMAIIEGSVEQARGDREITDAEIEALLPRNFVETEVADPRDPRREPRTPNEKIAAQVLMTVAGVCDGARKLDAVGFSAAHARLGRTLALELLATGKLASSQWVTALWFGRNYRKQAGL